MKETNQQSAIEREEHKLVKNALEFDDKPILDVMTLKKEIFSLDANSRLSNVIETIKKKQFSRIPLYSDTQDNITGILHIWDIAKLSEKEYKKTILAVTCDITHNLFKKIFYSNYSNQFIIIV